MPEEQFPRLRISVAGPAKSNKTTVAALIESSLKPFAREVVLTDRAKRNRDAYLDSGSRMQEPAIESLIEIDEITLRRGDPFAAIQYGFESVPTDEQLNAAFLAFVKSRGKRGVSEEEKNELFARIRTLVAANALLRAVFDGNASVDLSTTDPLGLLFTFEGPLASEVAPDGP